MTEEDTDWRDIAITSGTLYDFLLTQAAAKEASMLRFLESRPRMSPESKQLIKLMSKMDGVVLTNLAADIKAHADDVIEKLDAMLEYVHGQPRVRP